MFKRMKGWRKGLKDNRLKIVFVILSLLFLSWFFSRETRYHPQEPTPPPPTSTPTVTSTPMLPGDATATALVVQAEQKLAAAQTAAAAATAKVTGPTATAATETAIAESPAVEAAKTQSASIDQTAEALIPPSATPTSVAPTSTSGAGQPTATPSPELAATRTPLPQAVQPTSTNTPLPVLPTATHTSSPTASATATSTSSPTATPSPTAMPTNTPLPTFTPLPLICPGDDSCHSQGFDGGALVSSGDGHTYGIFNDATWARIIVNWQPGDSESPSCTNHTDIKYGFGLAYCEFKEEGHDLGSPQNAGGPTQATFNFGEGNIEVMFTVNDLPLKVKLTQTGVDGNSGTWTFIQ